jgi:hypothetical protein
MAMGSGTSIVEKTGKVISGNGTSYSTPVLAGLAACLWESLPGLSSFEMLDLLRETANRFHNPDSLMGYGIPDVYKAYLRHYMSIRPVETVSDPFYISINSSDNRLYINLINIEQYNNCRVDIYSALGNRLLSVSDFSGSIDVSSLQKGIYIACLQIGDKRWVRKFIKR